ncbi:MAG TPA: DUF4202 domain-containing protein [Casimicrobiaceae bacterium]
MIADRQRFERACARFDAANAEDPNREAADGREWPKELLYAERMSAMLERFAPEASEPLRLAVRCQHVQRWKIPRADYPGGRIGYLQWRKRLQKFHAALAGDILREVGYDEASIARVGALLKKEDLKADADVQTLEDVVDLVFLESYLAAFVAAHGEYDTAKFDDILRKTAKKMSPRGRAAALSLIDIPAPLKPVVQAAMSEEGAAPA